MGNSNSNTVIIQIKDHLLIVVLLIVLLLNKSNVDQTPKNKVINVFLL